MLNNICITAKINPDLDGVACAFGYADLLSKQHIKAEPCVFGIPQSEVQYFIKEQNILINISDDNNIFSQWDKFILVDASSMKGMPHVVKSELVEEVIDHRVSEPEKEFPNAKIQNELVGAAATLIVERFMKANILPEYKSAQLLYGAIFHNTLNFITANSTERDKKATQFLELNFGLSRSLIQSMFDYASKEIIDNLHDAIINDAKQFKGFNFYQLVMSNVEYKKLEKTISKIIVQEDTKYPCQWSILNVVDVNKKVSYLYVPSQIGQTIVSQNLECKFIDSWANIPAALRKEIMPKIDL
ncbi:DHH family phosphoesterase [Candidatus Dependentiae bacterium]|nr:DHH family phosphoesterase [Candidatus Dependentiae bacterium]